jgi:hypothetical protein
MITMLAAVAAVIAAQPGDAYSDQTETTATPPTTAVPQRPAILYNRWQEDWSVLADPALRTEPLDALKYIPLDPADPKTYLSLGASLRERFETNQAPLFGVVAGRGDSYVISRLEAYGDLRVGPIQAFVELQSDFAPGKKFKSPADSDRLDLEQGFVAFSQAVGPGTLKLRVGRQQFSFDLQRFASARDGPNVRQSFDAIWGDYEVGRWRLIGYYTRPVINRDIRPFDDYSSDANRFYGVRIERHVLSTNELSAYWSRFTNDAANFASVSGRERRDVFDGRFAGAKSAVDWDAEAMLQTGRVGQDRIRAWALGSRLGYTFTPVAWTPRIGIQSDAASGDKHPNDRTLQTFNPLFPNGNYLALAGYTGYVNFVHIKPSITVHPTPGLTLMGAVAAQWRETRGDAVYVQPSIAVPHTAGVGSLWTGAYGQFRADWKVTANLTAAIEAVHFAVGDTVRAAGGHDANYLGVEMKYAW